MTEPQTIALNHSEKLYLALEGVVGSVTQVYAVRFAGPVEGGRVRSALRQLVHARPRLRTCVERTVTGHRLRVRPVDEALDLLLTQSVTVEAPGDTHDEALPARMEAMLLQSFAVERDLPVKVRLVPNGERPLMLIAFHHIAGDGRSIVGWIAELVAAMNGVTPTLRGVDAPTYWKALRPRSLGEWWRALVAFFSRRKTRKALRLPRQPFEHFPPTKLNLRRLNVPASDLSKAAKSRGVTVGVMFFAAVCVAMRRVVPDSDAPIRARMSIDLRRLFGGKRPPVDGNYASSFLVKVAPGTDAETMKQAAEGMQAEIDCFENRRAYFPKVLDAALQRFGRKWFSMLALSAYRADRVAPQSLLLSNLGRIDVVNAAAREVRVESIFPSLPATDFGIGVAGLGGRLHLTAAHPLGVVEDESVTKLVDTIDSVLSEWCADGPAVAAPVDPPAAPATAAPLRLAQASA